MSEKEKGPKYLIDLLKAREYAFLGLYSQALSSFDSAYRGIEEVVAKSNGDKNIVAEWGSISHELREEMDRCRRLEYFIMSGRSDYCPEPPRKTEDDRRSNLLISHRSGASCKAQDALQQEALRPPVQ